MVNKKKTKTQTSTKIAGISMLVFFTIVGTYFILSAITNKNKLPVLGEPGHVAGPFSFINQDGKRITEKNVENKVTVVEYFFTSCPSICPVMNKNLEKLSGDFKTDTGFMILSHTVDPSRDSVSVMKSYANKYRAETPRWQFLTGNKDSLYELAGRDYLLSAVDSGSLNFIHTQYVALLDRKRQIRGFYDMTDQKNVLKLNQDVRILLSE